MNIINSLTQMREKSIIILGSFIFPNLVIPLLLAAEIVGKIIVSLRTFDIDLFLWRTPYPYDHVIIYVIAGILFGYMVFLRFAQNWWKSGIMIHALGDMMIVLGVVSMYWGIIAYLLLGRTPWTVLLYAIVFGLGIYFSGNKYTLKWLVISQIPVYVFWVAIGFPITVNCSGICTPSSLLAPTSLYNSIPLNIFEISTWLYPALMYIYLYKHQFIRVPKPVKSAEPVKLSDTSFSFKRVITDKSYFLRTLKQVIHYGAIGLTGIIINLITFNVLLYVFHVNPSVANIMAIAVSLASNVVIALKTRLLKV